MSAPDPEADSEQTLTDATDEKRSSGGGALSWLVMCLCGAFALRPGQRLPVKS